MLKYRMDSTSLKCYKSLIGKYRQENNDLIKENDRLKQMIKPE